MESNKIVDTIHELTLGVQKVYRMSSKIEENECGFNIYYNKNSITYYVLKNYNNILKVINNKHKNFNKINVYSDRDLNFLKQDGYIDGTSTSIRDNLIVYDNLNKKQLAKIRRAERFIQREGFSIVKPDKKKIDNLTDAWIENKLKDPRVYGITFSPNRYKNATNFIDDKNYSFYNVTYKNKLISSICFYNKDNVSYQLTYASDENVEKLTNDQYELILWSAFNDRFKNSRNIICMGTSGGIKNLEYFKNKFYTNHQSCYSYKKTNIKKGLFD